jgi:hypothetical protein
MSECHRVRINERLVILNDLHAGCKECAYASMAPDSSARSHVPLVAMIVSSGAEPHADARRVLISARRSLSQVLQLYAPRRAEVIFRKMGACRRADRSVGISMRTTLDHTNVLASSQGANA